MKPSHNNSHIYAGMVGVALLIAGLAIAPLVLSDLRPAPAATNTPTPAVQTAVATMLATPTPTPNNCPTLLPDSTPGPRPATADAPAGGGRYGGKSDQDEQASFYAVYGQDWQPQWTAEHQACL